MRELLHYPFFVRALVAGTVAALLCGALSFFVIGSAGPGTAGGTLNLAPGAPDSWIEITQVYP